MLFFYPDSFNPEELIQVSQKDVHQIDENTSINDDAAGNNENVNEIPNENNYNQDDFYFKCSFENCNSDYIGNCNECNNIEKCYCADHFNHDLHTTTNEKLLMFTIMTMMTLMILTIWRLVKIVKVLK
jgi:hypothetical protein